MSTFHHSAHFESHFGATDPTLNLVTCCRAGSLYKGDNICDDENNNKGCKYDGGDCCGSNVNTLFCLVCECLDPAEQGGGGPPSPSPPSPPSPSPPPPSGCGYPEYKGDNYCDDENNNAGCEWDGGDCCGDNVNTQYCSACECLDPAWGPCKV